MAASDITPAFKKFITSLVKRGNLHEESLKEFTNNENMKKFRLAFIHESHDPINNYELPKFLGDVTVNNIVAHYLRTRFPQIVSVKWLTRLKHNIISNRVLGHLARKEGFIDHIVYGEDMQIAIEKEMEKAKPDLERNERYSAMFQRSFEAFIGVLSGIVNEKRGIGVGYSVAYSVIKSFLDSTPISKEYKDIFDAKTRLKEIFDAYRWGFDKNIYNEYDNDSNTWTIKIYGYPKGGRVELASIKSETTKKRAQQIASQRALKKLSQQGIFEIESREGGIFLGKKVKITPNFKKFITSLLEYGGLSKKNIMEFTDDESMKEFRTAFIHKSYDEYNNYELLEFLGDVTLNDIAAHYILEKHPKIVSKKWLTRLKHNLTSKNALSGIANRHNFAEHTLYGKEIREVILFSKEKEDLLKNKTYITMLEDTFEAFVGALTCIVNSKYRIGIGYVVAYTVVKKFIGEIEITLKYEIDFDAKTQIKEIFDQCGWEFDKNIKSYYDRNVGMWVSKIFGFPKENKVMLGTSKDISRNDSQQEASRKAVKYLNKHYKIMGNPLSPYER